MTVVMGVGCCFEFRDAGCLLLCVVCSMFLRVTLGFEVVVCCGLCRVVLIMIVLFRVVRVACGRIEFV